MDWAQINPLLAQWMYDIPPELSCLGWSRTFYLSSAYRISSLAVRSSLKSVVQGSCGYGVLDKGTWPYWWAVTCPIIRLHFCLSFAHHTVSNNSFYRSVAAIATSNPIYSTGPIQACGYALLFQPRLQAELRSKANELLLLQLPAICDNLLCQCLEGIILNSVITLLYCRMLLDCFVSWLASGFANRFSSYVMYVFWRTLVEHLFCTATLKRWQEYAKQAQICHELSLTQRFAQILFFTIVYAVSPVVYHYS